MANQPAKKSTGKSTAKKSTAASKAAKAGARQPSDRPAKQSSNGTDRAVLRLQFKGEVYTITERGLTPAEVRDFRRETGMSFARVMSDPAREFDIDVGAVLLWLLDRRDDPDADLDWYLHEVYHDDFEELAEG